MRQSNMTSAIAQYDLPGIGQDDPVDRQSIYTERSKQTDVEALHGQAVDQQQRQELIGDSLLLVEVRQGCRW